MLGLISARQIGFRGKKTKPCCHRHPPNASVPLSSPVKSRNEPSAAIRSSAYIRAGHSVRSPQRSPLSAPSRDAPRHSPPAGTPGNDLFDLDEGTGTRTQVAPAFVRRGSSLLQKGPAFPSVFP